MAGDVSAPDRLAALQARVLAAIPLAQAMQVRFDGHDAGRLVVRAPLAPNINDKGTGFAGSLSALATLAGWSLVTLTAEQDSDGAPAPACEAAIARSSFEFLRPVRGELVASAWLAPATDLAKLRLGLAAGRRMRVAIEAVIGDPADPALRFSGTYAVWRAGSQPF